MKFSITKGLDIGRLNRKIEEATSKLEMLQMENPYIFMNEDTLDVFMDNLLVHEIKTDALDESIPRKYYNQTIFGRYHGCKVFIDNDLEYGEIELR